MRRSSIFELTASLKPLVTSDQMWLALFAEAGLPHLPAAFDLLCAFAFFVEANAEAELVVELLHHAAQVFGRDVRHPQLADVVQARRGSGHADQVR
jgi:hypothetical protein